MSCVLSIFVARRLQVRSIPSVGYRYCKVHIEILLQCTCLIDYCLGAGFVSSQRAFCNTYACSIATSHRRKIKKTTLFGWTNLTSDLWVVFLRNLSDVPFKSIKFLREFSDGRGSVSFLYACHGRHFPLSTFRTLESAKSYVVKQHSCVEMCLTFARILWSSHVFCGLFGIFMITFRAVCMTKWMLSCSIFTHNQRLQLVSSRTFVLSFFLNLAIV